MTTERRELLRTLLHTRATVTVEEAWKACRDAGLCTGGEGPEIKAELSTLGRRHDGFWRAMTNDERRRAVRWADYWTTR